MKLKLRLSMSVSSWWIDAPTPRRAARNYAGSTSRRKLQTMSNFLRKRRPTPGGTGIGPSSRTRPDYYHNPNLMTLCSEETTAHRHDKDTARHRNGVSRRPSAPQIVFGRYQCARQTLRSAFSPNDASASLTYLSQQSKDIEDNLRDLIPWLTKLKDTVTTPVADGNHEEAERRERLTRCVSYFDGLADPS